MRLVYVIIIIFVFFIPIAAYLDVALFFPSFSIHRFLFYSGIEVLVLTIGIYMGYLLRDREISKRTNGGKE